MLENTTYDTEDMSYVTKMQNQTFERYDEKQYNFYQFTIPIIGIIIMAANILVIVSVIKIVNKSPPEKATYIFMGNLALSDALNAFFVVGGALIPNDVRGVTTCYIFLGFILAVTMASLLSMVLMSLDRYMYIVHCMQYKTTVTSRRAKIASVLLWVIALLMGFVPLLLWKTDHTETCMFVLIASKECIVFVVVVGIFFPLTVVLISYAIVLRHAVRFIERKKARMAKNLAGQKYMKNSQMEEKPKSNKVLGVSAETCKAFGACVIIVIAFMITWGPYFIAALMYYACGSNTQWCKALSTTMATVLAFLGFSNSLINPLIYTWWQKGFWIPCFTACNKYVENKTKIYGKRTGEVSSTHTKSTSKATDSTNISKQMSTEGTSTSCPNDKIINTVEPRSVCNGKDVNMCINTVTVDSNEADNSNIVENTKL